MTTTSPSRASRRSRPSIRPTLRAVLGVALAGAVLGALAISQAGDWLDKPGPGRAGAEPDPLGGLGRDHDRRPRAPDGGVRAVRRCGRRPLRPAAADGRLRPPFRAASMAAPGVVALLGLPVVLVPLLAVLDLGLPCAVPVLRRGDHAPPGARRRRCRRGERDPVRDRVALPRRRSGPRRPAPAAGVAGRRVRRQCGDVRGLRGAVADAAAGVWPSPRARGGRVRRRCC